MSLVRIREYFPLVIRMHFDSRHSELGIHDSRVGVGFQGQIFGIHVVLRENPFHQDLLFPVMGFHIAVPQRLKMLLVWLPPIAQCHNLSQSCGLVVVGASFVVVSGSIFGLTSHSLDCISSVNSMQPLSLLSPATTSYRTPDNSGGTGRTVIGCASPNLAMLPASSNKGYCLNSIMWPNI